MNALAGILFFLGFVPYIFAICRGETVPSLVTWVIWASTDMIVLFAMIKKKAKIGQALGAIIGTWVTVILAIIFGKPSMGYVEWISIVGAVTGIVFWQRTGNPVMAIICCELSVFIGAFPTFANAYVDPLKEDSIAWLIWMTSCVCALWVIHKNKKWDLENALQPLTFTTIEVIMVAMVVVRPWFL